MSKLYEVLDDRDVPIPKKLGHAGLIETKPGGLVVSSIGGTNIYIDLSGDNDPLHHEGDVFTYFADEGVVRFKEITKDTLDLWGELFHHPGIKINLDHYRTACLTDRRMG